MLSQNQEENLLSRRGQLIELIQRLLTAILNETRTLEKGTSPFHCKDIPAISIGMYLQRIAKYAHCSNSVFVCALILIDRYQERCEHFMINYFCIHRLLICAIMVAAKFFDDFYYKNDYYAKIGGINKSDMNALELDMLGIINYDVFVKDGEFQVYLDKLQSYSQVDSEDKQKNSMPGLEKLSIKKQSIKK